MAQRRSAVITVAALCLVSGWAASSALAQPAKMTPILGRPAQPEMAEAPIAVCFAVGTDPMYAARVTAIVDQLNVQRFGADYITNGSWSSQGTPRTLLWSFAPDGLSIPGGIGEPVSANTLFATMDAGYASQGGRATWVNRFQQVFDRWDALTGLSYVRVRFNNNDWDDGAAWGSAGSAGFRGDVRISMHPLDGASNVLAYNSFPQGGDMVLDANDIGNFANASGQNLFLRNVAAHEHGHGIGLAHVCPANQTKLMEPFISLAYDGPRQDDTRGAQYLYGDAAESDNSPATAKALGALNGSIIYGTPPATVALSSDPNSSLASIDNVGKVDWFSFIAPGPITITVTVIPIGTTYDAATQTTNCTGGNTINALSVADLGVEVYLGNGATVIGSSNTAGAGSSEMLSNLQLPAGGTYYIRVFSSTQTAGQSQLYRLSILNPCPTFTQQPAASTTVCEGNNVLLTVAATGTPAPTYQWRRNNAELPGSNFPTLTILGAQQGDSGVYTCVATNSCGSTTSNSATVNITGTPNITAQPQSVSVAAGSPASFSVTTDTPAVAFQWRKNTSPIQNATLSTYSIASVAPADAGSYDCVLTTICDTATTISASLTVTAGQVCYPNCDGSTAPPILNTLDFACFISRFAANETYANCDNSTSPPVLNTLDFACFLTRFAAGCS